MNKSHFIHAGYALLMQLPFLLFGYAWVGAAFAVGFFVGVEWMQQIRVHVAATGRDWPTKLDIYDIWMGFMWDNRDRYLDAGLPIVATVGVALILN